MKRILLIGASLALITGWSYGAYQDNVTIAQASFTATNEGPRVIPSAGPGTVLVGVVVSSNMAQGSLKIYDSSSVASNQIAEVSLANTSQGAFCIPFNVLVSSGITYTTANNSRGVTIIYKRLRP